MKMLWLPRLAGGNRLFLEGRGRMAAFRVCVLALLAWGTPAPAQTIAVSGNPGTVSIVSAVAGQDLTTVINSSTTYNIVTRKGKISKVTAALSTALPAGVTLRITLATPAGATSTGPVALTMVAQDVVTNIPENMKVNGLTITYELSSTLPAGVVALASRTVTLRVVEI